MTRFWWVKQLVRREQISMLPPSLELLRNVEKVLATIETLPDEAAVRRCDRPAARRCHGQRLWRDDRQLRFAVRSGHKIIRRSGSPFALATTAVFASCSIKAGRTPATWEMFCGPTAAGAAASATKAWGSSGFGCFVSAEKNAACVTNERWVASAARLAPDGASAASISAALVHPARGFDRCMVSFSSRP
ncbi:hypothetical protein [Bradyrhizobium sp. SZCCHNS3052]|uniref:hypothetical protein n=1 Tax=Bradyrhizobium sp. SZCCHNS3052 TaxID=3057321 RepID=UPI002915C7A6|nr:hypothetical protein [Bradyrhizobium sp. SZCCHNS3052]